MDTTSTTPARPGRPLHIAATLVAVLGLAAAAVLLFAPVSAGNAACGTVLNARDPLDLAGLFACDAARDDRRTFAVAVGVVVLLAAGLLALLGANSNERARMVAEQADRGRS